MQRDAEHEHTVEYGAADGPIRAAQKGTVAEPGLVSIAPGNGVVTMLPVSVCQNVSTTAH
jgi:hypothetical protein